ncbi:ATP-binding cassette domain-containing protein [Helicobacter aurati]|nr:ATP-binding cassette domain-containing protein [Helicobacter aurati]
MTLAMQNITLRAKDSRHLLKNISLTIEGGKTTVLLGASGSGKTLSLSVLQGMIPPNLQLTSGEILLNNKPINPAKIRGRIFASIMQNPRTCFNPLFTMQSHIKETLHALQKPYDSAMIESVLHEVGLEFAILNRYAFELSGGMLQRAMIAIALLAEANFLLADEPTNSLDSDNQQKILNVLDSIQTKRNIGILLITHDLHIAIQKAEQILIIHHGMIQEVLHPALFDSTVLHKILIEKLLALTTA